MNKVSDKPKIGSSIPQVVKLMPGQYRDGAPLGDVQFLECKIILKADNFTSVMGFRKYGALMKRVADECGVGLSAKMVADPRPAIREVEFLDTADFRLYNNAFILRRRVAYEDGFPLGEPEIVFKFRHPDKQMAAEVDVRPNFAGKYRIKFKAEALPLKDKIGAYRLLYSHNVQFGLSQAPRGDRTSMSTLVRALPPLAKLKKTKGEHVDLVNQTIVEEVLQELGVLDFGKGITAKCNVALWRQRGDHKPLVGEFAFQCKFKTLDKLQDKARERCARFFVALQHAGSDWNLLGATKTGIVYRLKGNPPQAHE
jgi:hypothetical protein